MGVFVERGVFEGVFYVFGELGPVGFLVVSESSEGFSCGYFVFFLNVMRMGGWSEFKALSVCQVRLADIVVMLGEVGC